MSFSKKQDLVFGYIRRLEKKRVIIPKEIYEIILKYSREMRFHFEPKTKDSFEISDDGQTVTYLNGYSSIGFGPFFSALTQSNVTIHFKLHTNVRHGCSGFGFYTPEFTAFKDETWNPGKNHCLSININGYMKSSKEFSHSYSHMNTPSHMNNWCIAEDIIAIQLDMEMKQGRMWNFTKQNSCENNEHVLEIGLPEEVAILIYAGEDHKQTFSVVHQTFQ